METWGCGSQDFSTPLEMARWRVALEMTGWKVQKKELQFDEKIVKLQFFVS